MFLRVGIAKVIKMWSDTVGQFLSPDYPLGKLFWFLTFPSRI